MEKEFSNSPNYKRIHLDLNHNKTPIPESITNQYDEQIFNEFSEKYKRSLEAISSFKEILELKQNYGTIKHSYSVNRQSSRRLSNIKILPSIKSVSGKRQKSGQLETILNYDTLKQEILENFNDSPKKSRILASQEKSSIEYNKDEMGNITDSNFFKKSKEFRIREQSKKQISGSTTDRNLLKTSSNFRFNDYDKSSEFHEYFGLMSQKDLMALNIANNQYGDRSKSRANSDFLNKNRKSSNDIRSSSKNSLSPFPLSQQHHRTSTEKTILTPIYKQENAIKKINESEIDKTMGAPFIKLNIANLNNFKIEPLHKFDKGQIHEEDPAHIFKSGVDKGFSRFLNSEGVVEWKPCEVLDFDTDTQQFSIRWRHNGEIKQVSRLNLMFINENKIEFENRLQETLNNRYRFLYCNTYKKILEEEARKSKTVIFPNDQLERIVLSAFNNVKTQEQTELAYRLVDEMLEFYKVEVLKFSLELTAINNDLDQLKELFPHKYFVNILPVPLKDQDKLYIVANFREYDNPNETNANKKVLNIPHNKEEDLILSKELPQISYKIIDNDQNKNIYCKSLNIKHKTFSSLNDYYMINCDDITFANIFHIINNNNLATKKVKDDKKPLKTNDYQPVIITRTMKKKLLSIEELNKGKNTIKIKSDRQVTRIIEEWKQAIYRCLPRPISILSIVKPLIATAIHSISEINIFNSFIKTLKYETFSSLKDIKDITEKMKEELNAINDYIYYVDDSLYELRLDTTIKHNDNNCYDREEMMESMILFANIYIQSCIKASIKSSLIQAIEELEKYSAILPLPYLSKDLIENLSNDFLHLRALNREKLSLDVEDFNMQKRCSVNFSNIGEHIKYDRNLLIELTQIILKDLFNGTYRNRDFIPEKKCLLKPMFSIKYKVKEKEENKREKHELSKVLFRAKFREKSRLNIYQYKEHKIDIIKQQINADDTCPLDSDLLFEQNNNLYVTKLWFGWFKYHGASIEHVPKITDIEEHFKKMFAEILSLISTYNSPLKNENSKNYDTSTTLPLCGLEEDLLLFRRRFDNIFKASTLPLLSVLAILHNFEFLVIHKKTYFIDLETEFNDSKDISMICREIEDLEKDLDFILRKLPNHFNLGFFSLEISDFRKVLIKNTQHYLQQFKKFLEQTLEKILVSNEAIAQKHINKMLKGAPTLDDYIILKTFIEGEELQNSIELMREELQICGIITEYVEKFNLEYNLSVMELFFHSKSWIANLILNQNKAEKKLHESRPKFMKEIAEKNREISKELDIVKEDVGNFANCYDPNNSIQYYNNAKTIMAKINGFIEAGAKINKYEEALRFQLTDFSNIKKIKDDFDLYHLLWEFVVEKWIYRSENWMKVEFDKLEVDDMAKIILEGKKLLNMLEDKMRHNANLRDLISLYLKDVNKYAEYLEILQILKNESWKERHWQMLWAEMYPGTSTKFEMKNITLEKLLGDKLLTFTSTIFKIFSDAKAEHNVEQEINNIELSLNNIQIKTLYHDINDNQSICVLRGAHCIISKLDDHVAMCKHMLTRSENPMTSIEKLVNLESMIKGVRKLIKLVDILQKKIFKIYPILKYSEIEKHTPKDILLLFEKTRDSLHKRTEFIQRKKKIGGLTPLFAKVSASNDPDNTLNPNLNNGNQSKQVNQTSANNGNANPSLSLPSSSSYINDENNGESMITNLKELVRVATIVQQSLYSILTHIRNKSPRLYLLSDEHIMGLLTSSLSPKEITAQILRTFKGIKSCITSTKETPQLLITEGFISYFNETLYLNNNLTIKLEDYDNSQFFICDLIKDYELEMMKWLKASFKKCLPIFLKNSYDYISIWKMLKAKETIFQIILLLNQIGFYHDITLLIITNNIISDEKTNRIFKEKMLIYKMNIQKNLALFIEYFNKGNNTNTTNCNSMTNSTTTLGSSNPNITTSVANDKLTWIMYTQFITQIKHNIEILDFLIDNNVYYLENFEYLILPKMMIEYKMGPSVTPDIYQSTLVNCKNAIDDQILFQNNYDFTILYNNSEYIKLVNTCDNEQFNVTLRCFNYRQQYGFQIVNVKTTNNFIITPCTQRCFVGFVSAISTTSGALAHGPAATGKITIIEGLGTLLGREIFCLDSYSLNYESLVQNLSGMILGGYWITIKEFQDIQPGLLSLLGESLIHIRNALINNEKKLRIGGNIVDLNINTNPSESSHIKRSWAVFATMSISNSENIKTLNNLPKNLLDSFRITNLSIPDSAYLLKKHLDLLNFKNPTDIAISILLMLQLLSNGFDNIEFLYKDHVSLYDLTLKTTALYQKVTFFDVLKISESIQAKFYSYQMLLNQSEDQLPLDEILILFNTLEEMYYPRMNLLYRKKFLLAFNIIFQTNYTEENTIFKENDLFQKEFLGYLEMKRISKSSYFYEICYQLNWILDHYSVSYTSEKPKAIILYGDTGKSRIIQAVAEVRAKLSNESHYISYVNIDSTHPVFLFGGKYKEGRYAGLINSLVDQALFSSNPTTNELEDDNLLSINNQIVNQNAKDSMNYKKNWVIFEGSNHNLSKSRIIMYERILKILKDGNILSDDGVKKDLLSSMTFIMKIDKIHNLSPSSISDLKSLYVPEHIFDLKQEFLNWYSPLMPKSPFYAKYSLLMNKLYNKLIGPVLDYTTKPENLSNLTYYLGKKYFLFNFMSIFEIFLNETRKAEIAFGNVSDEEIEKYLGKNGEEKSLHRFNILRTQSEFNNPYGAIETTINDIYNIKLVLSQENNPNNDDDHLMIKNDISTLEKQTLMIESLCILTLIWTIGINFKSSHAKSKFSDFLVTKIKEYYKSCDNIDKLITNQYIITFYFQEINANTSNSMNDGYLYTTNNNAGDDKTVFDIFYDLYNQRWMLWKDYKLDNYLIITNNLTGLTLPVQELSKFNPNIYKIIKKLTYDKNNQILIPELGEQIFIHNNITKKLRFFLDYIIAYKKPGFVISEYENGKTVVIRNKLKQLLEMNSYKYVNLNINYHTTQEYIMKITDANNINHLKDNYVSKEVIIFIDDLHLASTSNYLWSLFLTYEKYKGWYDHNKNGFIKFNKMNFLYAASYPLTSAIHNNQHDINIFDENCVKYPQGFLKKMNIIMMQSMDENDLKSIFREYTEGIVDEIQNENLKKVCQKYFNRLYKFLYFHKSDMIVISKVYNCNYGLNTMLQMIKSLQNINWESIDDIQQMLDIFYYHLKRTFGTQFLNMKQLPDDLILFKPIPEATTTGQTTILNTDDLGKNPLEEEEKTGITPKSKNSEDNESMNQHESHEDSNSENLLKDDEITGKIITDQEAKDPIIIKIDPDEVLEQEHMDISPVKELEVEDDSSPQTKQILEHNEPHDQYQIRIIGVENNQQQPPNEDLKESNKELTQGDKEPPQGDEDDILHNSKETGRKKEGQDLLIPKIHENSIQEEPEDQNVDKQVDSNTENGPLIQRLSVPKLLDDNDERMSSRRSSANDSFSRLKRKAIIKPNNEDTFKGFKISLTTSTPKYKLNEQILERSEEENNEFLEDDEEDSSDHNEIEQFDIDSIDFLRKIPQEYLNYICKRFLVNRENKISDWIINGISLPFNMELLKDKMDDASILSEHNAYEFITPLDNNENKRLVKFLEITMMRYVSTNRSSFIIFNNDTIKSSTLINDICTLLIELNQKHEHLLVYSISDPLYIYHLIKYTTYIMNYGFTYINLLKKNNMTISNHTYFINLLCETLSISIRENKRCTVLIDINIYKNNDIYIADDIKINILKILNDINIIMNFGIIEDIIPQNKLKFLLSLLKNNIEYDHCTDNHLIYILSQKIMLYIKFIIHTDYQSLFMNQIDNDNEDIDIDELQEEDNDNNYTSQRDIITLLNNQFHILNTYLRRIILNDMRLEYNHKYILLNDQFKLSIHSNVMAIAEKNYKIEVELSTLYEKEYSQSILANYREYIITIDYIHQQLKNTLLSRLKTDKKTGDILKILAKRMRKKVNEIEHEIVEINKHNTQRQEEIEKIKGNIIELNTKKDTIIKENNDIEQKIKDLNNDLDGFIQEEYLLKKLQMALQDVNNQLITYNSKEFQEDIKFGKFIGSRYYTIYAYMFCLIYNIANERPSVDKGTNDIDTSLMNISSNMLDQASKEFIKICNDYSLFKNYLLSFKFNLIDDEKLKLLIDILAGNNLVALHIKCNKLQKNFMKWVDLIIETSKFELRKDYRTKEIKSIKLRIQHLQDEIILRIKLLGKIDEALIEQPNLQYKLLDKIKNSERQITNLNIAITKLINLYNNFEYISQKNFELNNPIAANQQLYKQYILALSIYITQCCKYPPKYRIPFFKAILKNMNPEINFKQNRIHRILHGEKYLSEILIHKHVPLCLTLIDNIAILDMITEIDTPIPLIIDPTGSLTTFLKDKHEKDIVLTQDNKDISIYEKAIKNGSILLMVDFTYEQLDIIECMITYKYNLWINRIYKKQVRSHNNQNNRNNDNGQSDDDDDVANDDDIYNTAMKNEDEIEFNGKKLKIHNNFRIILVLHKNKLKLSKLILEKLFIINNEINDDNSWHEILGDLLLSTCYMHDKETAIEIYFKEKINNELDQKFEQLIESSKKIDFSASIDHHILIELEALSKELKSQYMDIKTNEISLPKKPSYPQPTLMDETIPEKTIQDKYVSSSSNIGTKPDEINGGHKEHIESNKSLDSRSNIEKKPIDFAFTIVRGSEEGLVTDQSIQFERVNTEEQSNTSANVNMDTIQSKSIHNTQFNPTEAKDFFGNDDNIENRFHDTPDYLLFLNNFSKLSQIIYQHQRLFDYLYTLRMVMSIFQPLFGTLYSFSDELYLLNIAQAMEITVMNGHFRVPWKSQSDIVAFEMLVFYNTFHQIFCMLRTDHQTLFTFFFGVLLSKLTGEFKRNIWSLYLYGNIQEQPNYLGFESTKEWIELRKILIDYYMMPNNLIPKLRAFQIESLRVLTRMDLNTLIPNSSLNTSPESRRSAKNINLDGSSMNMMNSNIPIGARRGQRFATLSINSNFRIAKSDDKFVCAHLSNQALSEFDMPKLVHAESMNINAIQHGKNAHFFSSFTNTLDSNKKKNNQAPNAINITIESPGLRRSKRKIVANTELNNSVMTEKSQHLPEPEIYELPQQIDKSFEDFKTEVEKETNATTPTNILQPALLKMPLLGNTHRSNQLSRFSLSIQPNQLFEKSKAPSQSESTPSKNINSGSLAERRNTTLSVNMGLIDPSTPKSPSKSPTDSLRKFVHKFQEESKQQKREDKEDQDNREKTENNTTSLTQAVALSNLTKLIPNIRLILNDMEMNPSAWHEFINKSLIFFMSSVNKIFPQMPNNLNENFNPYEILALIKYIRPDALEFYTRCFLGETRHKYYYTMPKTNLESHARSNWYHKPTIIFYESEYKNPTEILELLAMRNNHQVYRVAIGEKPEKDILEDLKKCINLGNWFIIENLHIVKPENALMITKNIQKNLEKLHGDDADSCKVWITFYAESPPYNKIQMDHKIKNKLQNFFQSCFRIYLNTPSNVKGLMSDYFRPQLNNLFTQIEKEFTDTKKQRNTNGIHKIIITPEIIQKYRYNCQVQKGYVDLHEFVDKKLNITGYVEDLAKKIEIDSQIMKLRYMLYFLFSILRQRSKYNEIIIENYYKDYTIYISDKDWMESLDDILFYFTQNINKSVLMLEKYLCFLYNNISIEESQTFNPITIKYFFRNYIAFNEKMAPIQVKNVYYDLLRDNMPTERQIFECFKNYPNYDPIYLFGYNTNHEISFSYQRSKKMFELALKCEKKINKNQDIITELDELESKVEKEYYEDLQIKDVINRYILDNESKIKSDKEKNFKAIELVQEIMKIFTQCFELSKLSIFKTLSQEASNTIVKLPEEEPEDLPSLENEETPHNNHNTNVQIKPRARSQFVFNSPRHSRKASNDMIDPLSLNTITSITAQTPSRKPAFFSFGHSFRSFKVPTSTNTEADVPSLKLNILKKSIPTPEVAPTSSNIIVTNTDHQPHRNDVFKCLIMNELKEYNRLTSRIIADLIRILNYLKGLETESLSQEVYQVWKSIKNNKIPTCWKKLNGIKTNCENLYKYIKCFHLKADALKTLVISRNCEMYPLIPLDKLMDPIFLLKSAVWNYAIQKIVPIHEIEIVLIKILQPPIKQIADEGMFINGIRIKAGRLNETSGLIEEENGRQFDNPLPSFFMTFNRRQRPLTYMENDIHIPVYIKPKGIPGSSSLSSSRSNNTDIVIEYVDHIKKYSNSTYEQYLMEKNNTGTSNKENIKSIYPIRLPIIDPKIQNYSIDFKMKFYFYGKSYNPAEFWLIRGTSIYFEIYDP